MKIEIDADDFYDLMTDSRYLRDYEDKNTKLESDLKMLQVKLDASLAEVERLNKLPYKSINGNYNTTVYRDGKLIKDREPLTKTEEEDLENLLILFRHAKDGSGKIPMVKAMRGFSGMGAVSCKRLVDRALEHCNVDPTFTPHVPLPVNPNSLEPNPVLKTSMEGFIPKAESDSYRYDKKTDSIVRVPETQRLLPAAPTMADVSYHADGRTSPIPPAVRNVVLPEQGKAPWELVSRQSEDVFPPAAIPPAIRDPQWKEDDAAEADAFSATNMGVAFRRPPIAGQIGKDFPEKESVDICQYCHAPKGHCIICATEICEAEQAEKDWKETVACESAERAKAF